MYTFQWGPENYGRTMLASEVLYCKIIQSYLLSTMIVLLPCVFSYLFFLDCFVSFELCTLAWLHLYSREFCVARLEGTSLQRFAGLFFGTWGNSSFSAWGFLNQVGIFEPWILECRLWLQILRWHFSPLMWTPNWDCLIFLSSLANRHVSYYTVLLQGRS